MVLCHCECNANGIDDTVPIYIPFIFCLYAVFSGANVLFQILYTQSDRRGQLL